MINVKLLSHNNEVEFPNIDSFNEYLDTLINEELDEERFINWTHAFRKVANNNELFSEGDIILFVFRNNDGINSIFGKGTVNKTEEINEIVNNIKYKSRTYFSDIERTPLIPVKNFEKKFGVNFGHGETNIEMDNETLDDFISDHLNLMIPFEKEIKTYEKSIKNIKELKLSKLKDDEQIRRKFINKFTISFIKNMELEDYVIGRKNIDERGSYSFCYLIEMSMMSFGEIRGSTSNKFGMYYSDIKGKYIYTEKWGKTQKEAFENIKKEIINLIIAGNNQNYEDIEKNKISPLFKGKILSVYYINQYIHIFNEKHVMYFLKKLGIYYNSDEYNTLEKKKSLLFEYRNTHKYFKNASLEFFIDFLYYTFREVQEIKKDEVLDVIASKIQLVDLNYIAVHKKATIKSNKKIDFSTKQKNSTLIGLSGEKAILDYENQKLKKMKLYKEAQWLSKDDDTLGFDIKSYNDKGEEIYIEVKTTTKNCGYIDFYISINEIKHFIEHDNSYIYYLFDVKKNPKLHLINKQELFKSTDLFDLIKTKGYFSPEGYRVMIDCELVIY